MYQILITLNKKITIITALMLVIFFSSAPLMAQDVEEDDKFSMTVTLNSDVFFGFYPFFAGSYAVSDNVDFTFYGILWSGGTGGGWGNWTEFGGGVGISAGNLYINPQIGLLSGSLTSGLGTPVLGEGIVPNLTVILDNGPAEGELYAGYYLGLDHGNPVTNNYLHWWLSGGYKLGKIVSVGLHYEHLRFAGGQNQETDSSSDLYMAVGPYIKFADPNGGAFAKFITGGDLRSDEEVAKSGVEQPSFFKLTVGYGF